MAQRRDDKEWTTISIKKDTKKRLNSCGKMGDTQDAILNKLIDEFEGTRK